MTPAGQAAIDHAKANGQWDAAYASPNASVVPEDLQAALEAHPTAKAFYDTLNKTNTYAIHWRIGSMKTPQGRERKIAQIIQLLESGQKLH